MAYIISSNSTPYNTVSSLDTLLERYKRTDNITIQTVSVLILYLTVLFVINKHIEGTVCTKRINALLQ